MVQGDIFSEELCNTGALWLRAHLMKFAADVLMHSIQITHGDHLQVIADDEEKVHGHMCKRSLTRYGN